MIRGIDLLFTKYLVGWPRRLPASIINLINPAKEEVMSVRDDFRARNKAVDEAIKALKVWQRDHLRKALYENQKQWGIWPYEYQQLKDATRLVSKLLENLKDEDPRRKQ